MGHADEVAPQDFLGDPRLRVRALLPPHRALDLALNLMTFDRGTSLPFVETHVMEHGLLVLERLAGLPPRRGLVPGGRRRRDLDGPAFCPQWCCAYGTGPATYLIYKDWNRDVMT